MKRFAMSLLVSAVCLVVVGLSACNTTKGFGKDLEKGGDAIQNSADKHGAN